jgi:hypothetical protein
MPELLDRTRAAPPPTLPPQAPRTTPSERPARDALLSQVARLESELGALFCSTYPRQGFGFGVRSRGGPRILPLAELEALRDDLAERLGRSRRALTERTYLEEQHRRRIEEMLLEPEKHRWVRIQNEDIGERGCKSWHVRPRFGILGMLFNWWRVRISSGCPLARGRGLVPRPLSPAARRPAPRSSAAA